MNNMHLMIAVVQCTCLLAGWTSGREMEVAEKASGGQQAPHLDSADRSAGGESLAPTRSEDDLEQLLARLRLRASGQTPADTSLLLRLQAPPSPLDLLRIRASGQTPADTSLLPRRSANGGGPASLEGGDRQTPANVGLLQPAKQAARPPARPAAAAPPEDGVQRQEVSSFKQVNGESVRVVLGNYGYRSPEGLPVSFKYMSDENGNQASFKIGAAGKGTAAADNKGKGAAGAAKAAAKGAAEGAKAADADRKYLPPK